LLPLTFVAAAVVAVGYHCRWLSTQQHLVLQVHPPVTLFKELL